MISIHIVSYNKSKHAINAVQSVLNQKLGFGKYEILVLECGFDKSNIATFQSYLSTLLEIEATSIEYHYDLGNYGLAKGLNYLASVQSPATEYVLELNEDMFFGPNSIRNLVAALKANLNLGLACSNMINGGLYNKLDPKQEDVNDFARRYTDGEPLKLGLNASNLPWALPIEFFSQLSRFDVWNNVTLPLNEFTGIWDESIDPHGVGWYADHDIHNRIQALGRTMAIVENAHVYHYDHCSGSEKDIAIPNWTYSAQTNYRQKYDSLEKGAAVVKKDLLSQYPAHAPWW